MRYVRNSLSVLDDHSADHFIRPALDVLQHLTGGISIQLDRTAGGLLTIKDNILQLLCIDIRFLQLTHHIGRSEEHTSELQSRGHLVCRLLLEKKRQLTVKSQ